MMPYKDDYETIQGLWMLGVSPTNISASPVQGKANLAVGSPGGAAWR